MENTGLFGPFGEETETENLRTAGFWAHNCQTQTQLTLRGNKLSETRLTAYQTKLVDLQYLTDKQWSQLIKD